MSTRDYCNGAGHKGGAKSYRVCPVCNRELANTAFRAIGQRMDARRKGAAPLSDACRKCLGGYERKHDLRGGQGGNTQHDYVHLAAGRVPFAVWMERIRATEQDFAVVVEALGRYGMADPCPDEILEAYTAGRTRLHGRLFHACVLLANETRAGGRQATYNLTPRDYEKRKAIQTEKAA